MVVEIFYYKSSFGNLEIKCENGTAVSLKFTEKYCKTAKETDLAENIKSQLHEYFSGKRKIFDIKINPKGTEFQKKVWSELLKIPYGETRSYSQIAESIGNKNAQRAVGQACNKNPLMIIIPCHRVVSKNGKMTGYACGIDIKEKLLNAECNDKTNC